MDTNFHVMPPLKRFRLLQKQQQHEDKENVAGSFPCDQLPAKKRRDSRYPFLPETTTAYCLPAKKRVWAIQPDLTSPDEPLSDIDLNVEYKPPVDEEEIKDVKEAKKESEACDDDDGIVCAVCISTDGDPTDPIVFCDGCDLMVHASCYGNPLAKGVPEGDWFCNKCLVSQSDHKHTNSSSCCLCPTKGGAVKLTTDGSWAHVVCALLVPEVFFEDPDGREGIDCSKVPKSRWEHKCYICKSSNGCVIECSEPKCQLAFHVTCGLKQDLSIEYKQGNKKNQETIVAGFCKTHTELWEKQQLTGKFRIVAREEQRK